MDMLTAEQIAEADLADWRKLGQGLHAATWSAASAPARPVPGRRGRGGDALDHHPRATMGDGYVDLKLISDDAVYRDGEGGNKACVCTPLAPSSSR